MLKSPGCGRDRLGSCYRGARNGAQNKGSSRPRPSESSARHHEVERMGRGKDCRHRNSNGQRLPAPLYPAYDLQRLECASQHAATQRMQASPLNLPQIIEWRPAQPRGASSNTQRPLAYCSCVRDARWRQGSRVVKPSGLGLARRFQRRASIEKRGHPRQTRLWASRRLDVWSCL